MPSGQCGVGDGDILDFNIDAEIPYRDLSEGGRFVVWSIYTTLYHREQPDGVTELCELGDDEDDPKRYTNTHGHDTIDVLVHLYEGYGDMTEQSPGEDEDADGFPNGTIFVKVETLAINEERRMVHAKAVEEAIKRVVTTAAGTHTIEQYGITLTWPVPRAIGITFEEFDNWQHQVDAHITPSDTEQKTFGTSCVICRTEYKDKQKIRKWRCGHTICEECSDKMVARNMYFCQTCRKSRTTKEVVFDPPPADDFKELDVVVGTVAEARSGAPSGASSQEVVVGTVAEARSGAPSGASSQEVVESEEAPAGPIAEYSNLSEQDAEQDESKCDRCSSQVDVICGGSEDYFTNLCKKCHEKEDKDKRKDERASSSSGAAPSTLLTLHNEEEEFLSAIAAMSTLEKEEEFWVLLRPCPPWKRSISKSSSMQALTPMRSLTLLRASPRRHHRHRRARAHGSRSRR